MADRKSRTWQKIPSELWAPPVNGITAIEIASPQIFIHDSHRYQSFVLKPFRIRASLLLRLPLPSISPVKLSPRSNHSRPLLSPPYSYVPPAASAYRVPTVRFAFASVSPSPAPRTPARHRFPRFVGPPPAAAAHSPARLLCPRCAQSPG